MVAPASIMTIPQMDLLCFQSDAQVALHAPTMSSALCCSSNFRSISSSETVIGSGAYGKSIRCYVNQYVSLTLFVALR